MAFCVSVCVCLYTTPITLNHFGNCHQTWHMDQVGLCGELGLFGFALTGLHPSKFGYETRTCICETCLETPKFCRAEVSSVMTGVVEGGMMGRVAGVGYHS